MKIHGILIKDTVTNVSQQIEIMNEILYKEELLIDDPFTTSTDADGNEIYDAFDMDVDLINENMGWD